MGNLPVIAQQKRIWLDAVKPDNNTIALWRFDKDAALQDSLGNKHHLRLRGKDSTFVTNGHFKDALQVEEKVEPGDTRQGVQAANSQDLSPKSAFSIEMWIAPDATLAQKKLAFLIDKKSIYYTSEKANANRDYLIMLRKSGDGFIVETQLGFGTDTERIQSSVQKFLPDTWYHLAMTYDGAGAVTLYLNGEIIGKEQLENRESITAGSYPLTIGDRYGSVGARFPGRIDEVQLSRGVTEFASGKVLLGDSYARTAFYRMEDSAVLKLELINDTFQPLTHAQLQFGIENLAEQTINIPELAEGKSTFIDIPISAKWRPGQYQANAIIKDLRGKAISEALPLKLDIVPRDLPNQLPVVLWAALTDSESLRETKEIGFTHQLVYPINESTVWYGSAETPPLGEVARVKLRKNLNEMQSLQLGALGVIAPGKYVARKNVFLRHDRNEKAYPNVNGLYDRVQQFSYDVGKSVANHYKHEPVLQGALIHTEVRDGTKLSFDEIDRTAYRKFSGAEIPKEVNSPRGVSYKELQNFPSNHVIADDDPILKYYRWFWKKGDGWNTLHSRVNDGLKSAGNKDFWTWFDPAVRAPSVYGSGGNVDVLSQWTYTYPNPLKMDLATSETFAMAGGRSAQDVMSMTQIIWYRAQTTGSPIEGKKAAWENVVPDAKFISIAPDHLSEALWLQLAQPVQGIMYHGWGSLGSKIGFDYAGYSTTNPQTRERLKTLLHDVVKPLGPTLKQIPDAVADVAFLESFSSQMFAGRGTYGWGMGWGADSYIVARYAGLQPEVIYDETIRQKGLDKYKVLFVTDCDVLTESVVAAIRKFQDNGGIVIGDELLSSAIQPDILLSRYDHQTTDVRKLTLQNKAKVLRQELDDYYQSFADSTNVDVILRQRQFDKSDYVFAVNDSRTFGDYVGQHGIVMEKGLAAKTQITLNRSHGFVYDLTRHQQVQTENADGKVLFPVNLGAGEGNVFLITEKPVGKLHLTSPRSVQRNKSISVKVLLNNIDGKLLQAVVPLQITIRDAQGRVAEKSGFYGAANGSLEINLDIAPNDVKGRWEIEVEENITGQKILQSFEVN